MKKKAWRSTCMLNVIQLIHHIVCDTGRLPRLTDASPPSGRLTWQISQNMMPRVIYRSWMSSKKNISLQNDLLSSNLKLWCENTSINLMFDKEFWCFLKQKEKKKSQFADIHVMLLIFLAFCKLSMCSVICLKKLLILSILLTNLGCFCRVSEIQYWDLNK